MILITCFQESRECAGRRWPARECQLPDTALTEAELDELRSDPWFRVEVAADPDPDATAADPSPRKSKSTPAPADGVANSEA